MTTAPNSPELRFSQDDDLSAVKVFYEFDNVFGDVQTDVFFQISVSRHGVITLKHDNGQGCVSECQLTGHDAQNFFDALKLYQGGKGGKV